MTIPVLSHPQVVLADPDFFRSTSHLVGGSNRFSRVWAWTGRGPGAGQRLARAVCPPWLPPWTQSQRGWGQKDRVC